MSSKNTDCCPERWKNIGTGLQQHVFWGAALDTLFLGLPALVTLGCTMDKLNFSLPGAGSKNQHLSAKMLLLGARSGGRKICLGAGSVGAAAR